MPFDFYFLLPISRESIVLGQTFEMEILMDLHVLRSPESENHIFNCWIYVHACVYICMHLSTWLFEKKA